MIRGKGACTPGGLPFPCVHGCSRRCETQLLNTKPHTVITSFVNNNNNNNPKHAVVCLTYYPTNANHHKQSEDPLLRVATCLSRTHGGTPCNHIDHHNHQSGTQRVNQHSKRAVASLLHRTHDLLSRIKYGKSCRRTLKVPQNPVYSS